MIHLLKWWPSYQAGGFAAGGPTMKGGKDYLRNLSQVMVSDKAGDEGEFPEVLITEKDRGKIRTPHDSGRRAQSGQSEGTPNPH